MLADRPPLLALTWCLDAKLMHQPTDRVAVYAEYVADALQTPSAASKDFDAPSHMSELTEAGSRNRRG